MRPEVSPRSGSAPSLFVRGSAFDAFDGATWTSLIFPIAANLLSAVWGSGPRDVWFASESSLYHYNGASVTQATLPALPAFANFSALWGRGAGDVWAIGDGGLVLHFDGSAWSVVATPQNNRLGGITGLPGSGPWVGGRNGLILRYMP